jgi:hypothetical protein
LVTGGGLVTSGGGLVASASGKLVGSTGGTGGEAGVVADHSVGGGSGVVAQPVNKAMPPQKINTANLDTRQLCGLPARTQAITAPDSGDRTRPPHITGFDHEWTRINTNERVR